VHTTNIQQCAVIMHGRPLAFTALSQALRGALSLYLSYVKNGKT